MHNRKTLLCFTALSTTAFVCIGAVAAESSAPNGQLDEIIVTSRRTSETLQTTPVAVTAINAAELDRRQVSQLADLQRSTPNLSIGGAGTGPASIVYLAIRGEAQNAPGSTSDPAVGIYVDGVYYGRPVIGNLGVLDLASAEILRGPQGTLFGRNTTGGALNLTTQQPTNKFEGYVKAGIGNYNQRQTDVVVNIPLKDDELAARFAVRYDERDGYGNNPITGKDLGDIDTESFARATIRWSPTDLPLTLTVTSDYTHYKDNGTMYASFVNPTHVVVPAGGFGPGTPAVTTADLLAMGGVSNPT
ncbi:MAG: hypothetical protein JWM78_994 [Verrucomicrobiaceae bacterium]|nr:hypothetical protein [Verrucomicrobiaceae bacterium]